MPMPSCQTILMRSPLAPLKTYKSPACGSRPSTCCTCNASPFIPFILCGELHKRNYAERTIMSSPRHEDSILSFLSNSLMRRVGRGTQHNYSPLDALGASEGDNHNGKVKRKFFGSHPSYGCGAAAAVH